jgi:hypothetical protein
VWRVHLRGHTNILKRVLLHTGALNLGLLMRTLCGVGTPGASKAVLRRSSALCAHCLRIQNRSRRRSGRDLGRPRHRSTYTCVATAAESDSPS